MSKSYKKAVTIGVAAFSAVALLTTGAAAFVLTNEATNSASGNINVGTVVDGGVTIEVGTPSAIVLDAKEDDTSGRVQYFDDGNNPNMNISIDGTLKPAEEGGLSTSQILAIYDLKFTFAVEGAASGNFAKYVKTAGQQTPPTKEFLTLTYTDKKAGSPTATDCPVGGETPITVDNNGAFKLDIDFNWGTFFNNQNPSEYYDDDGAATSLSEVESTLNELSLLNELTYKVTLKAVLKTGQ